MPAVMMKQARGRCGICKVEKFFNSSFTRSFNLEKHLISRVFHHEVTVKFAVEDV